MKDLYTVKDLRGKIFTRAEPAITRWNRLEGRPRTLDFDRALRAEVRDPLWMLTRQWQMGEFRGDDAGSPVLARICTRSATLDRFQAGSSPVERFPTALPLEAAVERRPLPWRASPTQPLALDLRLALGRRWRQLLEAARTRGDLAADHRAAYRDRYRVEVPDPALERDAAICAHPEAWRAFGAAAGRTMDGYALIEYLDAAPANKASDGIGASAADAAVLDQLASALRGWLTQWIEQPAVQGNAAWQPGKLEYTFGCSASAASGDLVFRADEYHHGRLDWYALERSAAASLDAAAPAAPAPMPAKAQTFIPTGVVFGGMPATRWWSFEDSRTNFGAVQPDTTDLGKLLLLEFALVYANDWFTFPLTLPIGAATQVHGIALTNVFNERIWIEPALAQPSGDMQRFELFQPARPPGTPQTLLLLPAAAKVLESEPIEQVALVRDEMANMVWGVERRIALPHGRGKAGGEAALEFRRQMERIIGAPPSPPTPLAPIRYEVMNTVPEHWIPFVPVHLEGSAREVRLQRAALPRTLGPDPTAFAKVRPRTQLLNQGRRYFIDEEEVPRAGALVSQSFQRTRWLDGRPVVWLGAVKRTGRGEGSSGLAFDRLATAEVKST
jgi:hypothetical protein